MDETLLHPNPAAAMLHRQYLITTDWFVSALEGISPDHAKTVIGDRQNSLEWLAGHLVVGRYRNLIRLGVQPPTLPYLNQFIVPDQPPPNAVPFNPEWSYPGLTESIAQWERYSALLLETLAGLDEKALGNALNFNVPTGGNTLGDMLTFVALHESFHLGQMSILRKQLGYPAMRLLLRNAG